METCTRLLRNAFEKFVRADNGTDREAIEFMCENWPENFMLQKREDTAGLELSLQATARRIDDKIYGVAALTRDEKMNLMRDLSVLAEVMDVYNGDTRLLGGHGDVDINALKNAMIGTADALQADIV
jgi:hypothetical protein